MYKNNIIFLYLIFGQQINVDKKDIVMGTRSSTCFYLITRFLNKHF